METETFLPARLFLLAYDPKKQRVAGAWHLGAVLRAAALAELQFAGHVADENGRVVVTHHRHPAHGDPVLADEFLRTVLEEVAASNRPRKWQHWIGRRNSAAVKLVREQLAADHTIKAERRRALGLIPYWTVALRDTRARTRFAESARRALRGGEPLERLDRRDAAVVALAANGDLRTVVSGADRRKYKPRVKAMSELVGPVAKGLKSAVQAAQAAAAAG
ncbi:GOLPH3/VPS74 family protein [Cryptosporangium arvum]|uniref:GOLPH3/VPS74 family protein n=1 Tax=Cryptosporangium arvum TaxID=80871 RepID=UPI0004AFDFCF|nr:GPP34 family phosphoprotein [Cryptosporangium arvum]